MAQPEQGERVAVAGGAVALFGEGGEVGLVLHQDAGRQAFVEGGDEATVPLGQARRVTEFTGDGVDEAGGADSHGVQGLGARLLRGALDQGDGPFDGGAGAPFVVDGRGRLGEDGAHEVGDGEGDALGADVERGEMGEPGDDPVEFGVGAAALGACFADDLDQALGREPLDEVGDGGPGQAGELFQLPGRQGAFALEEAQREPVVDGPGGTR